METMNDSEFLLWIRARLESVHGENENSDYMRRFLAICENQSHECPNCGTVSALKQKIDLKFGEILKACERASGLVPFAIELRRFRIEHEVSLYDMAKQIGIGSAELSAVETGKKPLTKRIAADILKQYNPDKAVFDAIIDEIKRAGE